MARAWSAVKKFCRDADMILLLLCAAVSIFGLVMVASAVHTSANPLRYIAVQGVAILLGIGFFVLFSLIDVYDLTDYWKIILAFNIVFVSSTFFLGRIAGGNRNWIDIPLIGVSVQPAEVVKVSFILLLARQMYAMRERISSPLAVGSFAAHFLLMAAIIWVASGDLGMVVVYFFIFICMLFASGVNLLWFLAGAAALVLIAPVLWNNMAEYQQMRFLVVLDDTLDPLGVGYQATRSKMALGGGQLLGQGLFNGTQTQRGLIPEKHTDFIYSVLGEELGMIGCIAVLLLLVAIIIRCLVVATRARNGMGSLICVGVAAMLIFQTFENICMCVGLAPVIGITLPFFSYGGSSVVTTFAAMGLVSSVKMRPMPGWLRGAARGATHRPEHT